MSFHSKYPIYLFTLYNARIALPIRCVEFPPIFDEVQYLSKKYNKKVYPLTFESVPIISNCDPRFNPSTRIKIDEDKIVGYIMPLEYGDLETLFGMDIDGDFLYFKEVGPVRDYIRPFD